MSRNGAVRMHAAFGILLAASLVAAGEAASGLDFSFYSILQGGQIVGGKHRGLELKKPVLLNNALINVEVSTVIRERLKVVSSVEAATWYNTFPTRLITNVFDVPAQQQEFYLHRAEGIYSFGDPAAPSAALAIGLTPYKYNPDVRNLGEYLFRTGTYPAYILGEFEYAFTRITGVRLQTDFRGIWDNEFLLTQATQVPPFLDMHLTYITKVRPFQGLELGGGIQFAHLLPADEEETTPRTASNIYFRDSTVVDSLGRPVDTSYYTLKGIKLMGRLALDLKAFLPGAFWGSEDLRFYSEAALLGWKDYPVYFENRRQRMPVMFGFNLPAFGLLDVLSLEAEWFGWKYPNSYRNVVVEGGQGANIPAEGLVDYAAYDYGKDDWKWSVYARKTLRPGFQVMAQAARDHLRHKSQFEFQSDREELLTAGDHWYWMVRVLFGI